MQEKKIKEIFERVCWEEPPCVCLLSDFTCPYLNKEGSCTLYYTNPQISESELWDKCCYQAFAKWLKE